VVESSLQSLSVGEVGAFGSANEVDTSRFSLCPRNHDGRVTRLLVGTSLRRVPDSLQADEEVFGAVIVAASSSSTSEFIESATKHHVKVQNNTVCMSFTIGSQHYILLSKFVL